MTSKTQKYKKIGMVFCALIICTLLLVCTGCREDTDAKDGQAEFEIDNDYQRGPLTVHIRADKTKMTIAETFCLDLQAAIEPGYEVQMPKIGKELENFGIVDWDNLGDKLDEIIM